MFLWIKMRIKSWQFNIWLVNWNSFGLISPPVSCLQGYLGNNCSHCARLITGICCYWWPLISSTVCRQLTSTMRVSLVILVSWDGPPPHHHLRVRISQIIVIILFKDDWRISTGLKIHTKISWKGLEIAKADQIADRHNDQCAWWPEMDMRYQRSDEPNIWGLSGFWFQMDRWTDRQTLMILESLSRLRTDEFKLFFWK